MSNQETNRSSGERNCTNSTSTVGRTNECMAQVQHVIEINQADEIQSYCRPSYEDYCPNCEANEDYIFIEGEGSTLDFPAMQCLRCGLSIFPRVRTMDYEEIAEMREIYELPPIEEKDLLPQKIEYVY